MTLKPVILCGGSGTRLWPESRKSLPKQFIPMFGHQTLLDLTLSRVKSIKHSSKPIIVSSKFHGFHVKKSLNALKMDAELIFEPEGKNTTAAIYLAAKASLKEENLIIMPSDHFIPDKNQFIKVIDEIININEFSNWITLGVKPTIPLESYGYIQTYNNVRKTLLNVKSFVEKPSRNDAAQMLLQDNYFWNTGIFIGNAGMILNSIKEHANSIANACDNVFENKKITDISNEIYFNDKLFNKIPSESIDYSVMEKEKNITLYHLNCEWSDMGSWDAVSKIDNKVSEKKNIVQINSKNNFIRANKRVIATVGVENLIIIDSDNATLITKKNNSEKVKDVVIQLHKNNMTEAIEHTFENRPWGKFENLLENDVCKVKRIEVSPYKRLSLQFHKFRSEHWLVVEGEAYVSIDYKIFVLKPGESIDIQTGIHHYLENKNNKKLIVIETQLGTYFGEDDIVRLDDPYER